MTFKPKPALYTLPYGIEVIGEYGITEKNRYARVRIRPHPFFPDLRIVANGCGIRRSRVVMASILGRALLPEEVVHHINEDRNDDSPTNLEIVTTAIHNGHHKTGSEHRADSKEKISRGLKSAYAEGKRKPPEISARDSKGRIKKLNVE